MLEYFHTQFLAKRDFELVGYLPNHAQRNGAVSWVLLLALFLIVGPEHAQACIAKYILEDRSNFTITAFGILDDDGTISGNVLAKVVLPGDQQSISFEGVGPKRFGAQLSGNRKVVGQVNNLCASARQIVIFYEDGKLQMVVK
jgi:hypothetical protein